MSDRDIGVKKEPMGEQELTRLLDQKLCEIGAALLDYYNCCGIDGATCKAYPEQNLCCYNGGFGRGLCPYWQDDHCQHLNAGCRLWVCRTAIASTDPKCIEGLKLLEQFAYLFGLTRPPLIGHPYVGADRQPK